MGTVIARSVGEGALNSPADVAVVQRLLNLAAPVAKMRAGVPENGQCDAKTRAAIREFQRNMFGPQFQDGRVDPTGYTIQKLLELSKRVQSASHPSMWSTPWSTVWSAATDSVTKAVTSLMNVLTTCSAVQLDREHAPAVGVDLSKWRLQPYAEEGVVALFAKVPSTIITSGRRDRAIEAGAWAPNIAGNLKWMEILYAYWKRKDLQQLQADFLANPTAYQNKSEAIRVKLLAVFEKLTDAEMMAITPHFDGAAVDVAPNAAYTEQLLKSLPNCVQALNEGNHWHLGFKPR